MSAMSSVTCRGYCVLKRGVYLMPKIVRLIGKPKYIFKWENKQCVSRVAKSTQAAKLTEIRNEFLKRRVASRLLSRVSVLWLH